MKIIDQGIIIQNRKYTSHSFIVSILGKANGKWSGFYSAKKPPLLPGSVCDFIWSSKAAYDLGSLSIETVESSAMSKLWNEPVLMVGFSVICEAGSRFIPDGIQNATTFQILQTSLQEINYNNIYQIIKTWENHIFEEYLDQKSTQTSDDLPGFVLHCKSTKSMDTKLRNDLLAMLRL